jgi:hypothetical protein
MTNTMTKTKQPEFLSPSNTLIANTTGIIPTLSTSTLPIDTATSLSITLTNDLGQEFTFNTIDLSGQPNPNKVPFYITISSNLLTSKEFSKVSISSITDGSGNSIAFTYAFTSTQGFNYLCISPNNNLILQSKDYLIFDLTMEASANPVGSTGDLTFGLYGEKSNGGHYTNNGVGLPLTLINSSTSVSRLTDQLTVTIGGGQGSNPGSNVIYVSDSTDPIINSLTLTLSNNDPNHPLVTTPANATPQFTISFITCGDTGDGSVNALGTSSDVENITINEVTGVQGNYGWQRPVKNTQGLVTTWTLTPDSNNTALFGPGGSLNIPINDIISHVMPGTTMLYLMYVNIGGYEDGSIAVPILKANSQPTIVSFSTNKDSYEFFEPINFTYDVFGASNWALLIKDPHNTQVYYNSSLLENQAGKLSLQPLTDFSSPSGGAILSDLGTYTAELSNIDGNVVTTSKSFKLQNTSTIAINSLNITTDASWNLQNSTINLTWDVPNSIPGEGFYLTLEVTAINNGQTLATPFPINFSNNVLPSQTGNNVSFSLSGNLENLPHFDSAADLGFTLQLMYQGVDTPIYTATVSTTITCPLADLRPTGGCISVDSSGTLLPYASYISAEWFPPTTEETFQLSIGSYDTEENYYPLTYVVNGKVYGGSDENNLYHLPNEQTSQTFLITGLNPTAAGTDVSICLNASPLSTSTGACITNPSFTAVQIESPTLSFKNFLPILYPIPFNVSWTIPSTNMVDGITPKNFFISAYFSAEENGQKTIQPLASPDDKPDFYHFVVTSLSDSTELYLDVQQLSSSDNYFSIYLQFGSIDEQTGHFLTPAIPICSSSMSL